MKISDEIHTIIQDHIDSVGCGNSVYGGAINKDVPIIKIILTEYDCDTIIPKLIFDNSILLEKFNEHFTVLEIPCFIDLPEDHIYDDADDDDDDDELDDTSWENSSQTIIRAVINNKTGKLSNPFGYALYGFYGYDYNACIKKYLVENDYLKEENDIDNDLDVEKMILHISVYSNDIQNIFYGLIKTDYPLEYEAFLKSISRDMFTE